MTPTASNNFNEVTVTKSAKKHTSRQRLGNAQNGFLSVPSAAKKYGIPERTVRHWCETGKLPAIAKTYGRKTSYQVTPQAIETLLSNLQEEIKHKEEAQNPFSNHRDALIPWREAMERGLMTGKVFSPTTVEYYFYHTSLYMETQEQVSTEGLKAVLFALKPSEFPKKSKIYKSVVSFAKFLIQEKALNADFLEGIKQFRPKRTTPPKRLTVTAAGLEALEKECTTATSRAILILLSSTGLRASEFCNLKLSDIDFPNQTLIVRVGKGGKTRKLGLSEKCITALQTHLDSQPTDSYLFLDEGGHKMSRDALGHRLRRLSQKAGVPVTPHSLRRAFVTLNSNLGRPLHMLQRSCGHSDIRTTMAYVQTSENELIEAMKGWE